MASIAKVVQANTGIIMQADAILIAIARQPGAFALLPGAVNILRAHMLRPGRVHMPGLPMEILTLASRCSDHEVDPIRFRIVNRSQPYTGFAMLRADATRLGVDRHADRVYGKIIDGKLHLVPHSEWEDDEPIYGGKKLGTVMKRADNPSPSHILPCGMLYNDELGAICSSSGIPISGGVGCRTLSDGELYNDDGSWEYHGEISRLSEFCCEYAIIHILEELHRGEFTL